MKSKILFILCLLLSIYGFSQNNKLKHSDGKPVPTPRTDPFFNKLGKSTAQNPLEEKNKKEQSGDDKIQHVHSDIFAKSNDKYEGNMYFTGNVKFSHKGSNLTANEVVFYEKENFIKAIGNVKLTNSDGSVITANEMEYDGKSRRGIARGNVVMKDPKQTIKTETLYYDQLNNKAYYDTGAIITSESSTTYSKRGSYDVNTKTVDLSGNIKIDNSDYIVEGANISQNQLTNVATFTGPTFITDRNNPSQYVFTENGSYHMNSKEAYLNKNSRIHYKGKVLTGNKLYYNQLTGFGKGEGNVLLNDPKEESFIKGDYGEIYEKKDSAMITQNAYAVKVLKNDSIYFSAEKILAYQKKIDSIEDKKSFLRAYYRARFFKSDAQGRADSISFNQTDDVLHLIGKPILWSGTKQVSGDKIEAYFDQEIEHIDSLKIIGNAMAISKADSLNNKDEFNQVKGRKMDIYYQNNNIHLAKVVGNAQSITYADDVNEETKKTQRIGIAISSCGVIEALFEEQHVEIISCNIGAQSDVYPMSRISNDKRFFPDFNWNTTDRLKKWQDIFLDSPQYPEIEYISDNPFYEKAKAILGKQKAEEEAKQPKRKRR